MPAHPAAALRLVPDDRVELESWVRSTTRPAGQVLRARIVLAAADGEATARIAERLQVNFKTVMAWRRRYEESGEYSDF